MRFEEYHSDYRRRNPGILTCIVIALISALIGGIVSAYVAPVYLYGKYLPWPGFPGMDQPPQSRQEIVIKGSSNQIIPQIARKITPAVVGISTVKVTYDFFFRPIESRAVGSGVIVDPRGYILTNDHVVAGGEHIMVLLADGRKLKGSRLWSDPTLDLAVIKIQEGENLPVAPLGDSGKLQVGELAVAIGNPLGLRFQRTVTAGIISALDRSLVVNADGRQVIMQDLIQTDASINPGNSGGPLLNHRGEVIGINTVKASEAEAMGFVIPINLAKPIVKSIIEHGRFVKPWLGIMGLDKEIASYYGTHIELERGIYIGNIEKGSPAGKAGMKKGDVLLEIDGKPVETMMQLKMILYNKGVGETITVKVLRGKKELELKIKLEEIPREYR